jgi:hypothetical protein
MADFHIVILGNANELLLRQAVVVWSPDNKNIQAAIATKTVPI